MAEEIGPDSFLPASTPNGEIALPPEQVFLAETPVAAPLLRSKPPGPGLPESLLWLAGILPAQLAGVMGVTVFLFAAHYMATGRLAGVELFQDRMPEIIGGGQFGMLIYALGAIAIRMRPQRRQAALMA